MVDGPGAGGGGSARIVLSILMTSFNTADLTEAALASIAATTQTRHEVIVIDNGSTDDTLARIARRFPQVQVIALDHNSGYARANNLGAARARGDYLLIANTDIRVLDGGIDQLIAGAEALPAAGIWGMRTLLPSMQINPTYCWRRITLFSTICRTFAIGLLWRNRALANPENCPDAVAAHPLPVDIVTGCFLLISRPLWDRLDGFDAAFGYYGEDADLCLRAIALGAQPTILPISGVIHLGGGSGIGAAEGRICMLAARIGLIWRHMRGPGRMLAVWLTRLEPVLRLWFFRLRAAAGPGGARLPMWQTVWQQRRRWWQGY